MIGLSEFGRSRESALARVSLLSLLPYSPSIEKCPIIHGSSEEATREVSRPSIFGVFIIMVVYLPILTLTGIEG